MASLSLKDGDLVTVSLTYPSGILTVHGRWVGTRELAVESHEGSNYTSTPAEARREGKSHLIATWLTIYSETGNMLDAPAGARGLWGAQKQDASFRLLTDEWMLSNYDLKVRAAAPNVAVEPITEEGLKYIETNLSTDKRRSRLEDKLRAIDPELERELADVLYRVAEEAKADERRSQYDY